MAALQKNKENSQYFTVIEAFSTYWVFGNDTKWNRIVLINLFVMWAIFKMAPNE